jgi:uncharacterized protein YfaS (alpha-2-macroglobulin family)
LANYEGIQRHREFFSPIYEAQSDKNGSLPDTRNLLYWSPSIKTDKDGKAHIEFYTSDVTGTFRLEVQGLSKDGTSTHTQTSFAVTEKTNY